MKQRPATAERAVPPARSAPNPRVPARPPWVAALVNVRRHETLYQRFKLYRRRSTHLQAQIERYSAEPEKHLAEWQAEAQTIRIDEPPTRWAIYAKSWNQTIERHAVERKGYYRQIKWWQNLLATYYTSLRKIFLQPRERITAPLPTLMTADGAIIFNARYEQYRVS
jgi:hypothetical protein